MWFSLVFLSVNYHHVCGFTQRVITTAADGARSVYAADLDNDGFLDVLSASANDDKIAWYRNDGAGVFSAQKVITTAADGAWSVYAADLDNDGFLDVLSASASDAKIAWYRNDGSGGFSDQKVIITAANGARSVYAADLDNDGFLDVLSASASDDKISSYRNEGNGSFSAQKVITTAANGAVSIYAADLDNDGFLDVLSASANDAKIAWYRNDGAGGFSAQRVITTAANGAGSVYAADGARSVYAADLDNDGFLDVLSASANDDKIAWYRNDGAGGFRYQRVITTAADGAWSVYAADLDNDGFLDVLSASASDDKIAWYRNNGAGGFSAQRVITTAADGAWSVYAADLDNDGFLDVLSASANDAKIAWYRNDGAGGFSDQKVIITAADGAWSVYAADLDNDGFLDVLSASANDDKIAWYRNDGAGGFRYQRVITTAADGAGSIYAADLDNDGFLDVLSASANDAKIAWYRNDGAGGFSAQKVITTAADGAGSVYAADLDNDGFLDVLSASANDDKIAWYRNEGNGSFSAQRVITTAADYARSVYAADLDNDGFLDVLSASANDAKIAWYRNDGAGGFWYQRVITTAADGAVSIYAADLDNDGFLDVLSASASDDKIAWYRNDGAGGFSDQRVITTAADGAWSVYAADLDNDGFLDVLSASASDDKIAWYRNNGAGGFSAQKVITTAANGARSVYAADLDNDGFLDVLSASSYDDKIAWYSVESRHIALRSGATETSCIHDNICAGPITVRRFVLGMFHIQDHMRLDSPWLFAPGFPVTLLGNSTRTNIECHTGPSACLQFSGRESVHLLNLEISGFSHVFVHIENVSEVVFRNVHFHRQGLLFVGLQPVIQVQGIPLPPHQSQVLLNSVELTNVTSNSSVIELSRLTLVTVVRAAFRDLTATNLEPSAQPTASPASPRHSAMDLKAVHQFYVTHTVFQRFFAELRAVTIEDVRQIRLLHSKFEDLDCPHCFGAAIHVTMKTAVIGWDSTNVTFRHNRALRGGAIALLDQTTRLTPWQPSLSLRFHGLRFEGNFASDMGGAVYWESATKYTTPPGASFLLADIAPNLIMEDLHFVNNSAPHGGGLAVDNINVVMFNVSFSHNIGVLHGGGAWMKRASGFFSDCSWTANRAGVLPSPTRFSSTFSPNLVPGGGGLFAADCLVAGIVVVQSLMNNNSAATTATYVEGSGGAAFVDGCSFIMENTTAINNAAVHGGVTYASSGSSVQWRHVTATANSATRHGGALAASESQSILLENTMFQDNNAEQEGGAVWVRNTPLHFRSSTCRHNHATSNATSLDARGGCIAVYDAPVSLKDTALHDNAAIHGVGGNILLGCSTSMVMDDLSSVTNGSAIIGSNVMLECFDPDRLALPSSLLASGTFNSATIDIVNITAPRAIVNSIAAPAPVVVFHMLDAFGNFRWDDSSTVCTASATGIPSAAPAVILTSIRFVASTGSLVIFPFSVLAAEDSDSALTVSLACATAAGLEIPVVFTVPLTMPTVAWVQAKTAGFPSQRAAVLPLSPPLSVQILIGGGPTQELQSFVCSVSSLRPDTGSLIGTTTGTPVNDTLITFPQVGVDAGLASIVPVQATCQLPSGAMYATASRASIHVANITLRWNTASLPIEYPLASALAGSPLEGLQLRFAFTKASTPAMLPCVLETSVDSLSNTAISLLSPVTFALSPDCGTHTGTDALCVHEFMSVSLGIQGTSISAAPTATMIKLRARCEWNGETVFSNNAVIPIMSMKLQWAQHTPEILDAMVNAPLFQPLHLQWPAFLPRRNDTSNVKPPNSSISSFYHNTWMMLQELREHWAQDQDLECEMAAVAMVSATELRPSIPVTVEGPGQVSSAWDPVTATVTFSNDMRIVPSDADAPVGVALQANCILNGVYRVFSPTLHVRFLRFAMAMAPASSLLLPSARSNILGVTVTAAMTWTTHSSSPLFWAPFVTGQCGLVIDNEAEVLGSTTASLVDATTTSNNTITPMNKATFSNLGISAPPGSNVSVTAECRFTRGGAAIVSSHNFSMVNWTLAVSAPANVFRLEEVHITITVNMPLVLSTPASHRFPTATYFSETMACSLSALHGSHALTYPDNVLTTRLQYVSGDDKGTAAFRPRFDADPGTQVYIQATCQISERSVTSVPTRVLINEFTAAWVAEDSLPKAFPPVAQGHVRQWLPSSGTFLLPLQQPVPRVQFWSNQQRINDTSAINCDVRLSPQNTSASLMSPPALGYAGIGGYVALDRILLASEDFGVALLLLTACTRGAESLVLPALRVSFPDLTAHVIPPLPPATVVTQRPFSILMQLAPDRPVVQQHADVQCTLTCPEALALSGAVTRARNGTVHFDSAAITGVIGKTYSIHIQCMLGVMRLPSLEPIHVSVATCPVGTEPDSSRTQCRACPLSTYSDGGNAVCRGCPRQGALCSSGRIILFPGFFPGDTRLLLHRQQHKNEPSPLGNSNTSLTPADLLHSGTVLYPCWNGEACVVDSGNRSYSCSSGYAGPLCGVCDADMNYVRTGNVCTECWPVGLNIAILVCLISAALLGMTYIAVFQSVKEASPQKIIFRTLLTYIQMLSSLGLFQAQATRTFREIFGISETLGGSFVSAGPIQCVLRLGYYLRFGFNMGLPFMMIPLSIALAGTAMVVQPLCTTKTYCHHNRNPFPWCCCTRDALRGKAKKNSPNTLNNERRTAIFDRRRDHHTFSAAIPDTMRSSARCSDRFRQYLNQKAYLGPGVFVLFLSYNVLSTTAATMFKCRPEVIDGHQYLHADLAVQCYSSSHVAGMIVASIMALLFNLGMPVLLFLFLRRHRTRLRDPALFRRFGFLYQGYSVSRGRYAWESIVMLRKFSIVMVASTMEDPWYQAIAGISIVVIALALHLAFHPYDNALYNRLEAAVLTVLAVTQVISLVYLRSETVPMSDDDRLRINIVVTALLVVLNGAMFATLVFFMLGNIACVRQRCGCCCCCCCSRLCQPSKASMLQGKLSTTSSTASIVSNFPVTLFEAAQTTSESRAQRLRSIMRPIWKDNPLRRRRLSGDAAMPPPPQ